MSGYLLANTRLTVYRGTEDDGYGDEQHRLDPDAAIAHNIPATVTGAKTGRAPTAISDTTSLTPRNIEPLIVQVSVAADRRVPGGGIRVGDLLKDQTRDRLYAVKAVTDPYAIGRPAPDRVLELDRLS